jgi:hypothetical protein
MSRTDDIVELLTSLAHLGFDRPPRSYLILLSSPPLSSSLQCPPQFPRYPISFSCWDWHFSVVAFGAGHHLLFVCNDDIYSFRRLPNTIRSPLWTASSRMFSSSPHLSMLCSSVTYLFPSSLPMFPLRSISSLILLLPTSLVSSVPDFLDILRWDRHSAVIAFGAGHIILSHLLRA